MNVVKIYVRSVLRQALKLHEKSVSFAVYWHKLSLSLSLSLYIYIYIYICIYNT